MSHPLSGGPVQDDPMKKECIHGHTKRQVGCVSCVLVFDNSSVEGAAAALPRETATIERAVQMLLSVAEQWDANIAATSADDTTRGADMQKACAAVLRGLAVAITVDPDRSALCKCQGNDSWLHKHYSEPPYRCARCLACHAYEPAEVGPSPLQRRAEPQYPCAECGVLRSKAEGGTVFTVCDACWDKTHPKALQRGTSSREQELLAQIERLSEELRIANEHGKAVAIEYRNRWKAVEPDDGERAHQQRHPGDFAGAKAKPAQAVAGTSREALILQLALDYHKAMDGSGEGEYGCPGYECPGVKRLAGFLTKGLAALAPSSSSPLRALITQLKDMIDRLENTAGCRTWDETCANFQPDADDVCRTCDHLEPVHRAKADVGTLNAAIAHLEAVIPSSPGGSPWQSIESAPKDGTRVLIFDAAWCGGRPKQTVSYWQRYERIDDGSRQECGSWSGVTKATHWMPLPSPPDDQDAGIPSSETTK